MNVLSARRRTTRARFHADCRRSSRKCGEKVYQNRPAVSYADPDCSPKTTGAFANLIRGFREAIFA